VSVLVSLAISLTTTPMMCAMLLKPHAQQQRGRLSQWGENVFTWLTNAYGRTLTIALRHPAITMVIFLATFVVNGYLFWEIPKGFFPQQDNGRLGANIVAQQDVSFGTIQDKMRRFAAILQADPAIETVTLFTGGGGGRGTTANTGRGFISLKPRDERKITADEVITRLRPKLAQVPGATLFLQAVQDVRLGGPQTQRAVPVHAAERRPRAPEHVGARASCARCARCRSCATSAAISRTAGSRCRSPSIAPPPARLGVSTRLIDETLYDAFGQRQVSTSTRR
jgi:multidrug efflux pump